jgi:hypothetical protein
MQSTTRSSSWRKWLLTKKRSGAARLTYIILVGLLILSFGVLDGFRNHTIKMIIFFSRGANTANMAGRSRRSVQRFMK